MNDLISRQAAIDAFWKLDIELIPSAIDAIADMLKTLPYAQPERMRGRWSGPFCTKCGISKYNFVKILHTDDGPCGKWNFCPNCGADMRGRCDE